MEKNDAKKTVTNLLSQNIPAYWALLSSSQEWIAGEGQFHPSMGRAEYAENFKPSPAKMILTPENLEQLASKISDAQSAINPDQWEFWLTPDGVEKSLPGTTDAPDNATHFLGVSDELAEHSPDNLAGWFEIYPPKTIEQLED